MVVGASLVIGKIAPYRVEVDSIVELECATTLLRNLVVGTAHMMAQVIRKQKTAIHRSVRVSLIRFDIFLLLHGSALACGFMNLSLFN